MDLDTVFTDLVHLRRTVLKHPPRPEYEAHLLKRLERISSEADDFARRLRGRLRRRRRMENEAG